jgi:SulP family sulfate permease
VGLVLLALLVLTPLLAWLPKPALAAMIVMAVWNLIDVKAMRHAWRAQRDDGLAALLTFAVTLLAAPDIHNGVLAGIVFALAAFIYRRMLPRVRTEVDGQVGTLRFDAALFFANSAHFEDAVLDLMRESPALRVLIVPAQSINLLDATGAEMLRRLLPRLHDAGITFVVSGMKQPVRDVAQRAGVIALIGVDRIFDTEAEARRFAHKIVGQAAINEPEFSI